MYLGVKKFDQKFGQRLDPEMIYVLKLGQNKYYVGRCKIRRWPARLEQQKNRDHPRCSQWVKIFGFEEVLETYKENITRFDEDKWTKYYMNQKGLNNVRGGSYARTIALDKEQTAFIIRQIQGAVDMCYNCGQKGHFIRQCKQLKKQFQQRIQKEHLQKEKEQDVRKYWHLPYCQICSQYGHKSKSCDRQDLSFHIQQTLKANSVCNYCHRKGHYANQCKVQPYQQIQKTYQTYEYYQHFSDDSSEDYSDIQDHFNDFQQSSNQESSEYQQLYYQECLDDQQYSEEQPDFQQYSDDQQSSEQQSQEWYQQHRHRQQKRKVKQRKVKVYKRKVLKKKKNHLKKLKTQNIKRQSSQKKPSIVTNLQNGQYKIYCERLNKTYVRVKGLACSKCKALGFEINSCLFCDLEKHQRQIALIKNDANKDQKQNLKQQNIIQNQKRMKQCVQQNKPEHNYQNKQEQHANLNKNAQRSSVNNLEVINKKDDQKIVYPDRTWSMKGDQKLKHFTQRSQIHCFECKRRHFYMYKCPTEGCNQICQEKRRRRNQPK